MSDETYVVDLSTRAGGGDAEAMDELVELAERAYFHGDDPPLVTVHVAMSRVMREIGAIPKDEKGPSTQGGYAFRGIDTFMNRLHPIMAKHGVFVLPRVLPSSRYEFHDTQTSAGKKAIATHALLDIEFTFYGPQGDWVVAVTKGENLDTGDKASNGAMSAGLKYCLMQAFMVPTADIAEGDRDDNTLERFEDLRTEAQRNWQEWGWPASTDDEATGHKEQCDSLVARIKAAGESGADIARSVMEPTGRKWPPTPDGWTAIDKALAQLEAPFEAGEREGGEQAQPEESPGVEPVAARAAEPSSEPAKTEPVVERRDFSPEELSLAEALVDSMKMNEVTKSLAVLGVTVPKNTTVGMARNMLINAWQLRGLDLDGAEANIKEGLK